MANGQISPELWLQQRLADMRGELPPYVDEDMLEGLVSYCPQVGDDEVVEYMRNLVGESQGLQAVVKEYIAKRNKLKSQSSSSSSISSSIAPASASASRPGGGAGEGSTRSENGGLEQVRLQAYVKPRLEDGNDFSSSGGPAGRSRNKGGQPDALDGSGSQSGSAAAAATSVSGGAGGGGGGGRKGRRRQQQQQGVVGLAELEAGLVVFKQGAPCDCQATKHMLVNNCLGCGKIVCAQEGEGPCYFCGRLVAKEGSELAVVEEQQQQQQQDVASAAAQAAEAAAAAAGAAAVVVSESEARALAFRDRLVEYDRTSAQRTAVIDDQSDYFRIEGDSWLTAEERELLRRQEEERLKREEERKRKVIVTFDLIGRKVLMEDRGAGVYVGLPDQGEGAKPGGGAGSSSLDSASFSNANGSPLETGLQPGAVGTQGMAVGGKAAAAGEGSRYGAPGRGTGAAAGNGAMGSIFLPDNMWPSPQQPVQMRPSPNLRVAAPRFIRPAAAAAADDTAAGAADSAKGPAAGDAKQAEGKDGGGSKGEGKGGGVGAGGAGVGAGRKSGGGGRRGREASRVQHDDDSLAEAVRRAFGSATGWQDGGGGQGGRGGGDAADAGLVCDPSGGLAGKELGARVEAGRSAVEARLRQGLSTSERPLSVEGRGEGDNGSAAFDICPYAKEGEGGGLGGVLGSAPVQLLRPPGFGVSRGAATAAAGGRASGCSGGGGFEVLQEGMVLLKGWLREEQQVSVVQRCRALGLGEGGWYVPKFVGGGEMRLHMMCLGRHWEPNLKAYEERRTQHDDAAPPPVPPEFAGLVQQALDAARRVVLRT